MDIELNALVGLKSNDHNQNDLSLVILACSCEII